jgi:outer membrane protease
MPRSASGSTYMEDYDWLEPFAQAGAPDDQWSDRSRHSNTDLDRYINLTSRLVAISPSMIRRW